MLASGFIPILAAVGLYGLLHSWLASRRLKSWAEARFAAQARRFYRLAYVVVSALALLPLLALAALLPDRRLYTIPFPWLLLTLGLQVLSGFGLLVAVSQTGSLAFVGVRQVNDPQALSPDRGPEGLVTSGLYRYVRHPIYSFSLLALWVMPYVTWNILALMVGLTLYTLIGMQFEERRLEAEFGEAYRAYRKRTPALLPRLL